MSKLGAVIGLLGPLLAASLALSAPAAAQIGPGGLGDPSGTLPTPQPPTEGGKPGPEGPKTHAASGGETPAQLPTEAAQLPEDPNAIPEKVAEVIGSDFDEDYERGRAKETKRSFYGPYYAEESGSYKLQTIFPPLWLNRTQGEDDASLFGLSYYRRRSPKVDSDVLFPFFWKLRSEETYTTIVGPWMHSESPEGHDNWLAPFFFEGSGEDGTEYFHIPPLLTFHHRTARDGVSMAGPLFCKWTGGSRCDSRTADEIDFGVAPFYFYGRDDRSEYEIIPPLLHYYHYAEKGEEELDVWGPLWMESSREGGVFNILPLFWHNWTGDDEAHTTLFPLFHYGYKGTERTIATPLFVDHIDDEGAHTFATPLYARHRGRTELDMFTPLVWSYRDADINLERTLVFPFYYRNVSNRSDDIALFPFYGHFERHRIYEEHWITPLFRHRTDLTGWETDLFPLFFMGRENRSTHLVAAPLLFDFASPKARQTVIFPFYWRFSDQTSVNQLIGNTYYQEEKVSGGTEWQFHLFPLFSYGESPQGHWWNVLYGLAGYTREGTMAKMRIGYIPFELSE